MESLVAANLRSRPTRTIISAVAVAIGVILMLIVGGIARGTLDNYLDRNIGVGADFILQPSGSSIFYAFSSGTLSLKLADKLLQVPGIAIVAPILVKFSSLDFGLVFGIDLGSYNKLPGRLHIVQGRESLQDDEVIVDELYAKSHGLKPGAALSFLNHTFTVSAICRTGAVVRVFVPLKTLQDLNESPDKATIMFVKAAHGENVQDVFRRLKETFPTLSLVRADDPSQLIADARMPGFKEFRLTVVMVSMILSFMVILLAMYTTIFERTREIGILKSLGASRGFIVGLILKESVMICALGILLGIGAGALIRKLIIASFPTLQVAMSFRDLAQASVLGLLAGAVGAFYPAYKAARQDPVRALSYE